jgi:tetratricopeptide (TPR) repeat protein
MAKPKHIELTVDGVVSQEALLAYAEGRLSDAERAQVDQLLRDDPFAQEALDGLRASPQAAQTGIVITSINTRLREKAGLRERKKKGIEIHWANYAYAALILGILIGVGFVIIHIFSSRNAELVDSKTQPKAQESQLPAEDKDKNLQAVDSTNMAQDTVKKDTSTISAKTADTAASPALAQSYSNNIAPKDAGAPTKAIPPTVAATANNTTSTKLTADQTISMLGAAKTYFEAGDYINAEKKYNEILAAQPDNADALYFGGVSEFLNSAKGLGEDKFDKLSKAGQYPEGTKWYKANILIKKGKKEEAKSLLRDLVSSNSYFKDRAIKQYEELYGK